MTGESWFYLYGAARCDICSRTVTTPGEGIVPGAPVTVLPIGRLAAIFSPVSATAFGTRGIPCAQWLSERASEHHRVLESLTPLFNLAPMKLGAIWRSLTDVVRLFAMNEPTFERMVDRVVGASEWNVKLVSTVDSRRHPDLASGVKARAPAVHNVLAALAREASADFGIRKDFKPGGNEETLALDGAYLVEKRKEADFHHAFAQLRRALPLEYCALRLTGPLPPYNFANLTTEVVGHEGH